MVIDINLISELLDKHIGIVFFTLWLIFVVVSQKQQWKNLNDSWKVFWIALGLFCLASSVTAFYGFFLAPTASDEIDVYSLHRNLAILFFGIFGGCLAIWARHHSEKQLKNMEKQINQTNKQIRQANHQQFMNRIGS